ncbi:hypothetical protein [Streptomyces sp. NPDC088246]|uniref:hypothetical protein n=1 Tax=Streptomyces sp. NPDC088246 TaxID=3365842 RepID=UPI0037FA76F9
MRALRETSGLTGDTVGRRASMSAGKLSKIGEYPGATRVATKTGFFDRDPTACCHGYRGAYLTASSCERAEGYE